MSPEIASVMMHGYEAHLWSLAAIATRLLPIAFLCPIFGGSSAPSHVKLSVVLSLAVFVHVAGGVNVPFAISSAVDVIGIIARELATGVVVGVVAALPFDTARITGRFMDLFRGSSAEAALPLAGTKEAASGDMLHHLLVALSATGAAMPLLLPTLLLTFKTLPLGAVMVSDTVALDVVHLVGGAFSNGLALGAPIAALALCIDCGLSLIARAAPQSGLAELASPTRILAGGAFFWALIGLVANQLIRLGNETVDVVQSLAIPTT